MLCSLSGEICQDAVVTTNGDVYERRLIVKHIETFGTCPVSGEALKLEDLIPIKIPVRPTIKPRQISTASVPGLIQNFQNEWDTLMLETFNLKKQLEETRKDLAHSLYQNDAASRVIARIMTERDAARREVEQLRKQIGIVGQPQVEVGLSEDIKNKLVSKSQQLSSERSSRVASENVAQIPAIKAYKQIASFLPHQASSPGIISVDIHPTQQELSITGGVDRNAIVFDRKADKKISTLTGHTKEVTATLFHPTSDLVITGSADSTVRVWSAVGGDQVTYTTQHTFTQHRDRVIQVSLHATHDYMVSASRDLTWGFHSLETGVTLLQVVDPNNSPLTCAMFHPDGLILATGTDDNLIRIWDLKSQKNVATFQGHKGALTDLKFSENGYYLATSAMDNVIKLWDLRGPKNINSKKMDENISRLDYDFTGKYLAAAVGTDIRIFTGKQLDHVVTLDGHTAPVTDVKFGTDALFLTSTSLDRSLKFWG